MELHEAIQELRRATYATMDHLEGRNEDALLQAGERHAKMNHALHGFLETSAVKAAVSELLRKGEEEKKSPRQMEALLKGILKETLAAKKSATR